MKKRVIIGFCICAVLAMICAGCTKTESGEKPLRVLFSNAYYTAPYITPWNEAALEEAKKLGIELTILDANGSQQTQLEHVNLAIADGYDGFMYLPADVDGSIPVIEALNRSGIKWLGVNSFNGEEIEEYGMKYYMGFSNRALADTIVDILHKYYPNGCNLVAIEGIAGHPQTIAMNNVFDEKLGPEYVWIDKQDCEFKPEVAMRKMTDMLTAYGLKSKGGKIECIIAHDGGLTTGVISALEAQGYKPGDAALIVADSSMSIYNGLKDGWILGTATTDPKAEGKMGVDTMYGILMGTVKPGWTVFPAPMATKETVEQFNWY